MPRTPMTRRAAALAAALVSTALVLTACSGTAEPAGSADAGEATASSETRSFEADNGTVEIPVDPQRIVTIGSPNVFITMGFQPAGMIGAPDDSWMQWLTPEQEEAYAAAADLGGVADMDFEKLASLDPDLIAIMVPEEAWESGRIDAARLESIAPTVYLSINPGKSDMSVWKTQLERAADAVGSAEFIEEDKARYDELVAEIQDEYGDYLDSTTFGYVLASTAIEDGTFIREYASDYCTVAATEAGVNIPGETSTGVKTFEAVSMERLSDLAEVDVIVYDLGPDGEPNEGLDDVLNSNVWQTLPQVADGRAIGVECDQTLTYGAKITNLESLQDALGTLAAQE